MQREISRILIGIDKVIFYKDDIQIYMDLIIVFDWILREVRNKLFKAIKKVINYNITLSGYKVLLDIVLITDESQKELVATLYQII